MSKIRTFATTAVASLTLLAGSAMAALPSGVSSGLDDIQTDGLALVDLVWPVIIALAGAVVVMKLFKRFISKV